MSDHSAEKDACRCAADWPHIGHHDDCRHSLKNWRLKDRCTEPDCAHDWCGDGFLPTPTECADVSDLRHFAR